MSNNKAMTIESVYYDDFFDEPSIYWALVTENGRSAYIPLPSDEIEMYLPSERTNDSDYDIKLCKSCLEYLLQTGVSLSCLPQIEDASSALQYVFNDFWNTENEDYFIQDEVSGPWDELNITKDEFIRQIEQDIEKFNLHEDFAQYGDVLYSVSIDLLAAFSTKAETKKRSLDKGLAVKEDKSRGVSR